MLFYPFLTNYSVHVKFDSFSLNLKSCIDI